MKYLFLFSLLLGYTAATFAQSLSSPTSVDISKPFIDSSAINNWVSIGSSPAISNDGEYFMYSIFNQPINSSTLVVRSINDSWKKEFRGATTGIFSGDSRKFVFLLKDTLYFLSLVNGDINRAANISSYKEPKAGKGEWLAYQLKNDSKELVLNNLLTGKEQRFSNVIEYSFDNNGNVLLLKTYKKQDNKSTVALWWMSLSEDVAIRIWLMEGNSNHPASILSYNTDADGRQIVFAVQERKEDQVVNSIWYYKAGMYKAVIKVTNQSPGMKSDLFLNDPSPRFSRDGRYIFFQLQQPEFSKPKAEAVSIDVWSYRDTMLQSTQLYRLGPKIFTAVIGTEGYQVIQIQKDYDIIKAYPVKGDFVVIGNNKSGDQFWLNEQDTNWLVSLKDGSRKLLKTAGWSYSFSPEGNYLVYYDLKGQNNYFNYDLRTDKVINISNTVPTRWLAIEDKYVYPKGKLPFGMLPINVGIASWLEDDKGLLVYDNYDIWLLDLTGRKRPVNVTNGYGRLHHIKFRLIFEKDAFYNYVVHQKTQYLLLTAFNTVNKQNGFYRKSLDVKGDPELLTMGPYTLYHSTTNMLSINAHEFDVDPMKPIKAGNANVWIVKRQTNIEAPNYFSTRDFKSYTALTDLQPQKIYNWLRAELLTWKQLDGTMSQGILYKPENFDPKKKYPVLFNYYQQLSHRLYEYPKPDFTKSNINVSWFVSHGYLVFTPDIYLTNGRYGRSAYNTVVSAAQYLAKMPFVAANKMGINGHSFGGYLTNYIITHTCFFAAAIEGAGVSDYISSALQLARDDGASRLEGYEKPIKTNLWRRPDIFIDNSPILRADQITTPLIIFHGKIDTAVPWEQAVELFIALRRLGKKVWMLQYDDEDHGVWIKKDYKDYTIRITQFFDHYLKGVPVPKWMSQGIPQNLKGIESRYELDSSGSCGPNCAVCKKINAIYNKEHSISLSMVKESSEAGEKKIINKNKKEEIKGN